MFQRLGLIHEVLVLVSEPPVYVETVGAPIKWAVCLLGLFRFAAEFRSQFELHD